jgi:hypothetical protein
MDSLCLPECSKLLISGKFKYFNYNFNTDSLEILDGHFLKGVEFEYNITQDDVCLLKIEDLELKYDEFNRKITTSKEVIGSNITLEPFDNILFYLRYLDGYFDEELKLVEKEKAVKLQTLVNYQADKLNLPIAVSSSYSKNIEDNVNLLSIEGLPITPDSQEFQIILDGSYSDYASEFEGEFLFSYDDYFSGDKFQLVKVNSKSTLYNPLYGYLGRGINEYETECIMYYKEIPDNLVYLEKYEDNGMYIMRCSDGESSEDDYLCVEWIKCSYGPIFFTEKKEEASIFQFAICYELAKEEVSNTKV